MGISRSLDEGRKAFYELTRPVVTMTTHKIKVGTRGASEHFVYRIIEHVLVDLFPSTNICGMLGPLAVCVFSTTYYSAQEPERLFPSKNHPSGQGPARRLFR